MKLVEPIMESGAVTVTCPVDYGRQFVMLSHCLVISFPRYRRQPLKCIIDALNSFL